MKYICGNLCPGNQDRFLGLGIDVDQQKPQLMFRFIPKLFGEDEVKADGVPRNQQVLYLIIDFAQGNSCSQASDPNYISVCFEAHCLQIYYTGCTDVSRINNNIIFIDDASKADSRL